MSRNIRKRRKRVCLFCANKIEPHYKSEEIIRRLVTERGKILPRRMSGTCAKHQRKAVVAIKRARHLAFLPFVAENIY
jgi:small subunit ribosomal protein S18